MRPPVSKLPKKDDRNDLRCGLCGEPCTKDDFCFGCKFHICENHGDSPWGPHDVTAHGYDEFDLDSDI